jgi:UDP-GlcNAc:undecaprenyl-phosphate GlcNAc-1-phosphate transferase
MQTYLVSFVAATLASALFTPFARVVSFNFGIVSQPGGRHIHGRSIARFGGLGIFLAFMVSVAGLYAQGYLRAFEPRELMQGFGLMLGGTVMFLTGAVDDVRGVRALYKLFLQIGAAVIAWNFGFRIDVVDLPLVGQFSMGIFSLPVTCFWIVGIINAVNLIDGLDGLAAGVVFFAGVTNFVVAYLMGTTFVAVVMALLAGAVLGFLFYNFNPARIFMGDSGSYFLGFTLAVCSIAGPLQKASAAVSIAVPIVALGVPIIDTLLAMVRRFLERRPLFSPDRGHIHHRLLDMGITHRRAVLIIYGVTVALCVGAIGIAFGRSWEVGGAVLGVSAVLFGLIRFIGYFEYLALAARQRQHIHSRHVEWLRKVIMHVPAQLERAKSEDEVLDVFRWLAREAKLDSVALVKKEGRATAQVKSWAGDDYADMELRDACAMTLPIGLELLFVFHWRSEYGDVPPQMEIMLQLVVDQVEAHLRRTGSKLPAPAAATVAELQVTMPSTSAS